MSNQERDEIHIEEDEASGGTKEGVVRWILLLSLLGAILILSGIWIFGAATQSDEEAAITQTGNIEASQSDAANDGVLMDEDNNAAELDAADPE
ncbi:hypothetical protein CP97_12880 [Aurantiacibacter atlanticus]|uniref:Uncharacterized protein n=1 Tax=Aurantiacibacter atlanticus TaxID=1648404 RepID=A0A0H4VIQ3_9SPHN|nr:hypothetical protein [Aurantiacibacter atlanticus]AKQ42741.1 hypothetical protein CP97_12880 [Aurantiacibacter atlanticus]MDF1835397.1 hypothetical protein [Alteraurantiacibacter sp. bin_em_oilr2.035]